MKQKSDEELLTASVKRPHYFGELVDRYQKQFLQRAVRMVGSWDDAEDIVQDAFVKMYKNAAQFSDAGSYTFRKWAHTILTRTVYSYYREQGVRMLHTPQSLSYEDCQELVDKDAHRFADDIAMRDHVKRVFAQMSPPLRRVLEAYYLYGYSQKEIAKQEQVSVGTVKARMHRARHAFQSISETITQDARSFSRRRMAVGR